MKSPTLGVIVARFQVPDLSDGHRFLIDSVCNMHERVLIVLGETPARLTQSCPMPYEMRRDMVLAAYPDVIVECHYDQPDNINWSVSLDLLINKYAGEDRVILYGGRDSFHSRYVGFYRYVETPPVKSKTGTEIRAALEPRSTPNFRAGVVWAAQYKFPVSYQCVDMAVIDGHGKVLLATKSNEPGFRFPGGFVEPTDPTLEFAAQRELREETGIEPGDPIYIGSFRIDDYRYRRTTDKILTALFVVPLVFGAERAGDDVDKVMWEPINDTTRLHMISSHQPLFDAVCSYLEKQND